MNTGIIREKLHQLIENAEDKKIHAIYNLLQGDVEQDIVEYSDEFKTELDKRIAYFNSGGKMVSALEMNHRLQLIRDEKIG